MALTARNPFTGKIIGEKSNSGPEKVHGAANANVKAIKVGSKNPYMAARSEWNERYGGYIQSANRWRLMAFLSMGLAIPAVIFSLYQSGQTKIVPYVVEVDALGNAQASGVAKRVEMTETYIIKAGLAEFINNMFGVTVDGNLQRQRIDKLYAYISGNEASYNKLNSYFAGGGDPFKIAGTKTVSVRIVTINSISDLSYRIEWIETDYDRSGIETGQRRKQAIVGVRIVPPTTDEIIRVNPMGVYVTDIDWTEVSQ